MSWWWSRLRSSSWPTSFRGPHLSGSHHVVATSLQFTEYGLSQDAMTTNSFKASPASLAFLAIYNPALGVTDDEFHQQLVFYYSRAAIDARIAAKKNARDDAAGGDALRAEENEKLRQIGLAQGMVDFAK